MGEVDAVAAAAAADFVSQDYAKRSKIPMNMFVVGQLKHWSS
jgi:hypothetical protein